MLQLKALSVDLSSLDMVEKVAGRACAVLCKQNQYGYPQHLFNQIHLINFDCCKNKIVPIILNFIHVQR